MFCLSFVLGVNYERVICRFMSYVCAFMYVGVCETLQSQLGKNNGTSLITSPCTGGQGVCVYLCVCLCVKPHGGRRGGSCNGEKRGRQSFELPFFNCVARALVPSLLLPSDTSLDKSPAIFVSDWSGRSIYRRRGSVKSGHNFKNFQTRLTGRDSVSEGLTDRGKPRLGQTTAPHTPNKNCCFWGKKKDFGRQTAAELLWRCFFFFLFNFFFCRGIFCTAVCLFSLSFSYSPSSQISMLCFGICAPNPSSSSPDPSHFYHLNRFELHFCSRRLQPNKLRQTFAEFDLD